MTLTSAVLDEWMAASDPYDYDPADVGRAQLELANERLQHMRDRIDALDHVAKSQHVDGIRKLADLIPVLFSHESYKSYPEALVRTGRWQYLSAWLSRFTTVEGMPEVDMAGVDSLDGWLGRLRAAGFRVFGSSGTSGRASLFAISEADRQTATRMHEVDFAWGPGLHPGAGITAFLLVPRFGFMRGSDDIHNAAMRFANEDATTWMSQRPLRLTDINRLGELRQAIAKGTARPSDIAALTAASAQRDHSVLQDLESLVDAVEKARREPVLIWGGWAQQYRLTEMLRARGHSGPFLHPQSVIHIAGGKKGVSLPDDFEHRARDFWGLDPQRYLLRYGCSEIVVLNPACRAGRYHIGPWVIPLVLDKSGTQVLSAGHGECTGRMAFMDLTSDGRWGGVVTGDRVSLRSGRCDCGRAGATVSDISRYMDLDEGEDKLSCAGTIESYVRGEMVL